MNVPRASPAVVVVNDKIIAIGGISLTQGMAQHYKFSLKCSQFHVWKILFESF
jgi:hypothetical protein